jgi:V/A-type H+-transporting ATPase subunit E
MSLESILNHILGEADTQRDKIIQEAKQQQDRIIREAKLEAERLYREAINKEKVLAQTQKQKLIVNARLEEKKNLLKAKQELIDSVFKELKSTLARDKFKKQQVLTDKIKEVPEDIDFYLGKIRQDCETDIARILFS